MSPEDRSLPEAMPLTEELFPMEEMALQDEPVPAAEMSIFPGPEPDEMPPHVPQPRRPRSLLVRSLVPVSLLSMVVVVSYTVKIYLPVEPRPPVEQVTQTKENSEEPTPVEPIIPAEENIVEPPPVEIVEQSVAEAVPPVPEIVEPIVVVPLPPPPPPPVSAPELRAVDGGVSALALLKDFLAMKTLAERIPHIESKLQESELAGSVLDEPLPGVMKISVDVRETNAAEQIVDFYYLVDFSDAEGAVNPQTLLVRSRGSGAPKVVVEPFLDMFGGRFARYAEKPTPEAGTFQVIISAGAFCRDDVPAPDMKYTLKILSRDDTQEIAKAYFGKNTKIGVMLEDETSGLAYGQVKPCTVLMRWNMEENPNKPFLEALEIKALNWNP